MDFELSKRQKYLLGGVGIALVLAVFGIAWAGQLYAPLLADDFNQDAQPEFSNIELSEENERIDKRYKVVKSYPNETRQLALGQLYYTPDEEATTFYISDMSNRTSYLSTYLNESSSEPVFYQREVSEEYKQQNFNPNRQDEIATGTQLSQTATCGTYTYGKTNDASLNSQTVSWMNHGMFSDLKLTESGENTYTIEPGSDYMLNSTHYMYISRASGEITVDDSGAIKTANLSVTAYKYETFGGVLVKPGSRQQLTYSIEIVDLEPASGQPGWISTAEQCLSQSSGDN